MEGNYMKIGSYTPGTDGAAPVIEREYFQQGYIVKDEEAYLNYPDKVCYVPELFDEGYTRQDFLDMCYGQEEMADMLFEMVDWQSPETLQNELFDMQEIDFCPVCKKLYFMAGEQRPCPVCGTNPEEVEDADTESECRPAEPGGL